MNNTANGQVEFEWPASFWEIKRKYLYTRFSVTYEDLQKPVKGPVIPQPGWAVEVTTFVKQCKECGYNHFNQSESEYRTVKLEPVGNGAFNPHQHDMEETYLRIAYCLSEELAVALKEADGQAREWVNEHIGRVKQKP